MSNRPRRWPCLCWTVANDNPTPRPYIRRAQRGVGFDPDVALAAQVLGDACAPLRPHPSHRAQRGDAFDLATVLVSLLLGAGYDAYVVMGYAPLALTRDDQSAEPCPYLGADLGEGPVAGSPADSEDDRVGSPALHEEQSGQSSALGAARAPPAGAPAAPLRYFSAHAAVGCWAVV